MSGRITGEEGDSGCCDNLTPEVTTETSARRSGAKKARNADLILKYISEKKFIIAAFILIIVLIIVIISLAAKVTETCPSCQSLASQSVACPDFWIGYRGKCFYVSKDERNWTLSLKACASLNASLAVIDSQSELEFWVNIFKPFHYWFGLSRKNEIWKWSNGTEFKNQFPVRADGFCAYVNGKGASSTICSMEKRFLCSQPENCRKPE